MIDKVYIIAFGMALTNLIKHHICSSLIPFTSLGFIILLSIFNALLSHGDIRDAIKDGFIQGGLAVGIFASGSVIRDALL